MNDHQEIFMHIYICKFRLCIFIKICWSLSHRNQPNESQPGFIYLFGILKVQILRSWLCPSNITNGLVLPTGFSNNFSFYSRNNTTGGFGALTWHKKEDNEQWILGERSQGTTPMSSSGDKVDDSACQPPPKTKSSGMLTLSRTS